MSCSIETQTAFRLPHPTDLPPLSRALMSLALSVSRWERNHRSRRALALIEVTRLQDIGMEIQARDAECAKPFWRD